MANAGKGAGLQKAILLNGKVVLHRESKHAIRRCGCFLQVLDVISNCQRDAPCGRPSATLCGIESRGERFLRCIAFS